MGYKWYKLEGFKPWWNNLTSAIPERHIEQIVEDNPDYSWKLLNKPAINWGLPNEVAILNTNNINRPNYLKVSDGENDFYFYANNLISSTSYKNGNFLYTYDYILDKYMTYFHNKLKILLLNHVVVKHINKYINRVEVKKLNDKNYFYFDYINNKGLSNTLPFDNQFIRKYLYGTNADKIVHDNFYNVHLEEPLIFNNFTGNTSKDVKINLAPFYVRNSRHRYTYIVCKSSAKQVGKVSTDETKKYANNTKLIIPLFKDARTVDTGHILSEDSIMSALNNFSITEPQEALINALSNDNFIGFYDCDIPYAMWAYEAKKNNYRDIKQISGTINNVPGFGTVDILAWEVPTNYAPKWLIIPNKDYKNGFVGRFEYIINNIDTWTEDTEPALLNPSYYQELTYINDESVLNINTSLFNYIQPADEPNDLNIKAYFLFDSKLSISYFFDKYNNTLNPYWNNTYSNLSTNLSLASGVFGSSTANYYANNANTAITSIDVRNKERIQSGINAAGNILKTAIGGGSEFLSNLGNIFNPISWFTGSAFKSIGKLITAGPTQLINIGKEVSNTVINNMIANRRLSEQINNINQGASSLLNSPYLLSAIPNEIKNINGIEYYLFNTYSNELHPWSKHLLFKHYLTNGYPVNLLAPINDYDNRILMNVLQIDTTENYNNLLMILNEKDRSLFNSNLYNTEFLSWLSNLHQLYKTDNIINTTEPHQPGYQHNIERQLHIINIEEAFKEKNINFYTKKNIIDTIKYYNDDLQDEFLKRLQFKFYNDKVIVSSTNPIYYGEVILTGQQLPDVLKFKNTENVGMPFYTIDGANVQSGTTPEYKVLHLKYGRGITWEQKEPEITINNFTVILAALSGCYKKIKITFNALTPKLKNNELEYNIYNSLVISSNDWKNGFDDILKSEHYPDDIANGFLNENWLIYQDEHLNWNTISFLDRLKQLDTWFDNSLYRPTYSPSLSELQPESRSFIYYPDTGRYDLPGWREREYNISNNEKYLFAKLEVDIILES